MDLMVKYDSALKLRWPVYPELPYMTFLLQDLPEDQCIYIRGFRVARKLMILPRGLKAAAGSNPDAKGDDCEPDIELTSLQAVPEVNILFWNFQVHGLAFEVPGSPPYDTPVYHGSEYAHMSYLFWY